MVGVLTANLTLDHLVVAAETLAEGVAYVESILGVAMEPGGEHPAMGTHNQLLSLGAIYLEVIAINPETQPPNRPRWFGLDTFKGAPRLSHWVARTTDIAAALALAPPGTGAPTALSRGDLRWTMAVPETVILPFDNAFPALIEWHGQDHPASRLPDSGCRLASLKVGAKDAQALRADLQRFGGNLADYVSASATPFQTIINTPTGPKTLT